MRRQLSCSFCKELYREPILLQCDHNLCRTCLPKVQVGTSDIVRCPECHQDCNNTALRRNPLLENIVERYREAEGNQQLYCEEHGVRLELFCKEEQKAICLVCGTSQRHRDHQHEAIAVAADGYKRELENSLRALQEEENEARKCLEEEKQEIRKLKDIGTTLERAEVQFINPERPSVDLCEEQFIGPLQYKVWKRMKDSIIPVLKSITIDQDTAHKQLLISRDRSGIKYGLTEQDRPDREERFENSFAALGSERFTSGRHYWEVEVGDKAFWKLGVAKESIERKEPLTNTPQDGLWVLGLGNRNNYMVFTPEAETFPLEVRPRKVGVYLDYEGGKVSFYNADNVSHIYTYTDTFTERMYPYFSPYSSDVDNEDDLPLRIVPL
ncbi:nuclear factor 7, ovary-like isoform X2 [Latimeria chalumnae]|uniref:nuclear factor 7, ovary-like isoform X2 n=1 Tax=Latimeria chalumnae TaxID=7897 RepID=UPI00313B27A1